MKGLHYTIGICFPSKVQVPTAWRSVVMSAPSEASLVTTKGGRKVHDVKQLIITGGSRGARTTGD